MYSEVEDFTVLHVSVQVEDCLSRCVNAYILTSIIILELMIEGHQVCYLSMGTQLHVL